MTTREVWDRVRDGVAAGNPATQWRIRSSVGSRSPSRPGISTCSMTCPSDTLPTPSRQRLRSGTPALVMAHHQAPLAEIRPPQGSTRSHVHDTGDADHGLDTGVRRGAYPAHAHRDGHHPRRGGPPLRECLEYGFDAAMVAGCWLPVAQGPRRQRGQARVSDRLPRQPDDHRRARPRRRGRSWTRVPWSWTCWSTSAGSEAAWRTGSGTTSRPCRGGETGGREGDAGAATADSRAARSRRRALGRGRRALGEERQRGCVGIACPEDMRYLRARVPPSVGVKASGGIKSWDGAVGLLEAGADLLGSSAGVASSAARQGRAATDGRRPPGGHRGRELRRGHDPAHGRPVPGETRIGSDFGLGPGGKGSNQADPGGPSGRRCGARHVRGNGPLRGRCHRAVRRRGRRHAAPPAQRPEHGRGLHHR